MAPKGGAVDLYSALELTEDADEAAIKNSYRKLVLKWHPDKNLTDRAGAEERIRLINTAYATLSNPTKRERYDLQRSAVDKRRRGEAPSKPKVAPKIAVPKEFMIQPLEHTEKFVRCLDRKTAVQSRQDVPQVSFDEFFQNAKFSLWWLPDVNNMCRVRTLGSKTREDKRAAAAGLAGGLNLSFRVRADTESEVLLAPAGKGKKSANVDFVAKESPVYEGAFRFETACRRGHYLAFLPPSDLRTVPFLDEVPGRVIDFMLVDFKAALKFKDLDEVLMPAAGAQKGERVPVAELREAGEVARYFKDVLKKAVWDAEDFAAYFEGHWQDWDFRAEDQTVRLRPPEERLSQVLRSAAGPEDLALALDRAGEELHRAAPDALVCAVRRLVPASGPDEEEAAPVATKGQKRKLLEALVSSLSVVAGDSWPSISLRQLLDVAEAVPALAGKSPSIETIDQRSSAVQLLLDAIVARISRGWSDLRPEDLSRLVRLPGIAAHDTALKQSASAALEAASQEELLQVMRGASAKSCLGIAGVTLASAAASLEKLPADGAVALLCSLAEAGAGANEVTALLRPRASAASAPALAAALLAVAERGAATEGLAAVAECLSRRPLAELGRETVLGLAAAAAKNAALDVIFSDVAQAAVSFADLSAAELVRLLLVAARGKGRLRPEVVHSLLERSGALVAHQLESIEAPELVKVVLAASALRAPALLEAAAAALPARAAALPQGQLLVATQALAQALGPGHAALRRVLEHWARALAAETGPALAAPVPGDGGRLTAEQLGKLALAAGPALGGEPGTPGRLLADALGARLLASAAAVPERARALLEGQLSAEGALAQLPGRAKLLAALRGADKRERSPSPPPAADDGRGHLKKGKRRKKKP
ncbi:unnamed protein product [Prorocentrum cordatum]|uniref:J domain-containing protein n=1 Tax=Prorocentrum cordatum TaxID=2364126 RepID=A0ABN9RZU9_9DINO|nr:unnamed protein product [Polarella glacialis]